MNASWMTDRLVHALGFRYRLHVRSLPGAPDLVFPRLRKVIFVSGCFWHMHTCGRCRIPATRRSYWVAKLKRNAARDKRVQRALRRAGGSVLVVWECQTAAGRRERLRARLMRFLSTQTIPPASRRNATPVPRDP